MIYAVWAEGALILALLVDFAHIRGMAIIAHIRINEVYKYVADERAADDFYKEKTGVENSGFVVDDGTSLPNLVLHDGNATKIERWPPQKDVA